MSIQSRVLQIKDLDLLMSYDEKKRKDQFLSDEEIIFSGWNSRSRKESLEHYLPMGWSFGQEHIEGPQSHLIGYFLAQPLVFFEGQTQSLWVEHIQYNSLKVRDDLCEMAYRISREKHFQRIYFPVSIQNGLSQFKTQGWGDQHILVSL